jgi:hypothetical protein
MKVWYAHSTTVCTPSETGSSEFSLAISHDQRTVGFWPDFGWSHGQKLERSRHIQMPRHDRDELGRERLERWDVAVRRVGL